MKLNRLIYRLKITDIKGLDGNIPHLADAYAFGWSLTDLPSDHPEA